jgi:hypothetical protein
MRTPCRGGGAAADFNFYGDRIRWPSTQGQQPSKRRSSTDTRGSLVDVSPMRTPLGEGEERKGEVTFATGSPGFAH